MYLAGLARPAADLDVDVDRALAVALDADQREDARVAAAWQLIGAPRLEDVARALAAVLRESTLFFGSEVIEVLRTIAPDAAFGVDEHGLVALSPTPRSELIDDDCDVIGACVGIEDLVTLAPRLAEVPPWLALPAWRGALVCRRGRQRTPNHLVNPRPRLSGFDYEVLATLGADAEAPIVLPDETRAVCRALTRSGRAFVEFDGERVPLPPASAALATAPGVDLFALGVVDVSHARAFVYHHWYSQRATYQTPLVWEADAHAATEREVNWRSLGAMVPVGDAVELTPAASDPMRVARIVPLGDSRFGVVQHMPLDVRIVDVNALDASARSPPPVAFEHLELWRTGADGLAVRVGRHL